MMRRGRLLRTIALAAGMLLAGVGCSADTTTTTSPTTEDDAPLGTLPPPTLPGTTARPTGVSPPDAPTTTAARPRGTGGGTEPDSEFCVQMTSANDAQKANRQNSSPTKDEVETFIGYLAAALAEAPDDAQAPLTTLITAYKAYQDALGGPNPEEAAFAILATPANLTALTALGLVVKKTCGFELSGSGSGSGSGTNSGSGSGTNSGSGSGSGTGTNSGSGSGSGTGTNSGSGSGSGSGTGTGTNSGSENPSGSTTGYDCSTITGLSEETERPTSISAVQRALCVADNEAPWLKAMVDGAFWSVSGGDWEIVVYSKGNPNPLSAADAVAACRAISKYLGANEMNDAKITVSTAPDSDAPDESKTVLARRSADEACTAP